MYDTVPRKAGIIDNDMNFPPSKICSLFNELVNMIRIQHVPRDSRGGASSLSDLLDDGLSFRCTK